MLPWGLPPSLWCKLGESDGNQEHKRAGTSLVVPVVKTSPSIAGDKGSIPGRGAKMPHSMQRGQEVKKKRRRKHVPLELSELSRGVCP